MQRRDLLKQLSIISAGACLPVAAAGSFFGEESSFARHLKPVGRALEVENYYVWCNSPIQGNDGKIHVFFSRWIAKQGMGGWINGSEILTGKTANSLQLSIKAYDRIEQDDGA